MLYTDAIQQSKNYLGNVVVQIGSQYFATRLPDSGLSIAYPYDKCVAALSLNPSNIDPRRVTTTLASFSFKLVDINGVISQLVLGDSATLNGETVNIWVGRSNVGMDFSEYFQLPVTYVLQLDHSDNGYTITSTELTTEIDKIIFNFSSALAVDILAATTVWTMRDDISTFPTSGFLNVDQEFVSYTGVDLVNNRFTGVVRGELGTTPADHKAFATCVLVETVTDNPLNIIMQLLISKGGGGTYDVLQDGCAISDSLIDVAGIEALRDSLFVGVEFTLSIYNIPSALTYIETELLAPNNLRFTYSSVNSKLTLAVLDKAIFVPEDNVIDEDTITKYPQWNIDGSTITNIITVEWDWSEALQVYQQMSTFQDSASITTYGQQNPLDFQLKGPKAALNGAAFINDFGTRLLGRLSTPSPIITVTTQIDKSLQNLGDKAYLVSSKVPASDGSLNFSSDLEIISRSINQTNGQAQFKLAYTSYTNIRSAFIAPSDLITSIVSQKEINVALGRGSEYLVGWYMRLWDDVNKVYCADAPNEIVAIELAGVGLLTEGGDNLITEGGDDLDQDQAATEDSIIFANAWTTTITYPNNYRIRFAQYDDCVDSQKRYGFINHAGSNFDDGKPPYKVTY